MFNVCFRRFPDGIFARWEGRKFWCTWKIFLAGLGACSLSLFRRCKGNNISLRFTNIPQKIIFTCLKKVWCSDAALQFSRSYSHTLKILLYLYINIELIFDFHTTCFGTATLHQVQHLNQGGALPLLHFSVSRSLTGGQS